MNELLYKPVITVKEARKLLGKDVQILNDFEIEKIIDDLDFLARYAIRHFIEDNKRKIKQR